AWSLPDERRSLRSGSTPLSRMSVRPARNASTIRASRSMPVTWWPIAANPTADTVPVWPRPQIRIRTSPLLSHGVHEALHSRHEGGAAEPGGRMQGGPGDPTPELGPPTQPLGLQGEAGRVGESISGHSLLDCLAGTARVVHDRPRSRGHRLDHRLSEVLLLERKLFRRITESRGVPVNGGATIEIAKRRKRRVEVKGNGKTGGGPKQPAEIVRARGIRQDAAGKMQLPSSVVKPCHVAKSPNEYVLALRVLAGGVGDESAHVEDELLLQPSRLDRVARRVDDGRATTPLS